MELSISFKYIFYFKFLRRCNIVLFMFWLVFWYEKTLLVIWYLRLLLHAIFSTAHYDKIAKVVTCWIWGMSSYLNAWERLFLNIYLINNSNIAAHLNKYIINPRHLILAKYPFHLYDLCKPLEETYSQFSHSFLTMKLIMAIIHL